MTPIRKRTPDLSIPMVDISEALSLLRYGFANRHNRVIYKPEKRNIAKGVLFCPG
jgi:hypothetical protein